MASQVAADGLQPTAVLGNHITFAAFLCRSAQASLPPCCKKHHQGLMTIPALRNPGTPGLLFASQRRSGRLSTPGSFSGCSPPCATLPARDAEEAHSLASSPSRPFSDMRGEGNRSSKASQGIHQKGTLNERWWKSRLKADKQTWWSERSVLG